jgi:ABC-type multidrug transport system fused ATPase/permease subunit
MKYFHTLQRRYQVFLRCLQLLNAHERKRIRLIIGIQITLTGVDVLAVGLVSILGALMVTGIQSQTPGNRVSDFLEIVRIDQLTFQSQIAVIAITTALLLIVKTLFTMVFFRRQVFFLTNITTRISKHTISRIISAPYLEIQKKSVFNYVYAVSSGINSVTNGVIGTTISLISDFVLLSALIVSLIFVDLIMGLLAITLFGVSGMLIYRLQSQKARKYGHEFYAISIQGEKDLNNVLNTQKEMTVKARLGYFEKRIHLNKDLAAHVQANMTYMPAVPRYLMDLVLVVGGFVICGVQFALNNAQVAFATLSVFLVASSRMLPALIRIQQALVILRSSVATAEPFLALNIELPEVQESKLRLSSTSEGINEFHGSLEAKNVRFGYGGKNFTLQDITFSIRENTFTAIMGPSGAGKTTLMDLMLGIIEPHSGNLEISGVPASQALIDYPGLVAYLPQDVQIIESSIRENVVLGFEAHELEDNRVWEALEIAQLSEFVRGLPSGLDTSLGVRGVGLSGGQKQRLAIARAVVTRPKILFLDEATSALDTETEKAVTDALYQLKGKITLIVIAHRVSTIMNADKAIYLEAGKIIKDGSIQDIIREMPNFAKNAGLLET